MDNHSTHFLVRLLHKLCLVLIIFSLSLFDISHSLSVYKFNNPIQLSSAFAEGDSHDAWQGNDDSDRNLGDSNYSGGRGECASGENSKDDECMESQSYGEKLTLFGEGIMTKEALDRWLSSFMMMVVSIIGIGAAVSCANGVRKGMMNHTCSFTAVPLAIGALSYIAGEVALYIQANKNVMSNFTYNEADLNQWSEFCKEYNSHDDRDSALAALDGGELNQYKPDDVEDEVFGITGTETVDDEDGEETTTQTERPFEVYCDQVAVVQSQVDALRNLSKGLNTKLGFTWTTAGSMGLAGIVELVQAGRQAGKKAEAKSSLAELLNCYKNFNRKSEVGITQNKKDEKRLKAIIKKSPSGKTIDLDCPDGDLAKIEMSKQNRELFQKICHQPMKVCVQGLRELFQFREIYGKKKAAQDSAPTGASGLMCIKDLLNTVLFMKMFGLLVLPL